MANATYDAWKQELLGDAGGPGHGTTDFEADNFKMILLDAADHTTNTATDADHANLTAGGIVATSANMTSMAVTIAAGTATVDCADFTWSAVTGDQSEEVVFYKDSGVVSHFAPHHQLRHLRVWDAGHTERWRHQRHGQRERHLHDVT